MGVWGGAARAGRKEKRIPKEKKAPSTQTQLSIDSRVSCGRSVTTLCFVGFAHADGAPSGPQIGGIGTLVARFSRGRRNAGPRVGGRAWEA